MPKQTPTISTKDRDLHVRLTDDDYVALAERGKAETRSTSAQALFYIRRGIAQDAKK